MSRAQYVIAVQAAAILIMAYMAAAVVAEYPGKIDRLVDVVVPVEQGAAYSGPFASNVQYDGIVPSIYLKDHDLLTRSFDRHVTEKDDFGAWKVLLLGENRTSVTDFGDAGVTVAETAEFDGYARTKYLMDAADGDVIIFWELIPKNGAEKHPAVMVIPGTGHSGARDLIGEPSSVSEYYYQAELAARLANEGYATYVPELRGYGERAIYTEICDDRDLFTRIDRMTTCHQRILSNQLGMAGIGIDEYRINDITQVLRHMTLLGYVDADKIAVGGLSLGAGLSQTISNNNPDVIKATFLASGIGSIVHAPPAYQSGGFGRLVCCDGNEMAAAIAPRALYVSFGLAERGLMLFEAETGHTGGFLGRVYSLLDAEDNFTYAVHDGGHEYDVPSILEFLDRHLKTR